MGNVGFRVQKCGFLGTLSWVYRGVSGHFGPDTPRYADTVSGVFDTARYASDTLDTPDTPDTCIGRVSSVSKAPDTPIPYQGVSVLYLNPPMHPHVSGLLPIHSFGHFVMWVFRYNADTSPIRYRRIVRFDTPDTRPIRAGTQPIRSSASAATKERAERESSQWSQHTQHTGRLVRGCQDPKLKTYYYIDLL